MPVKHPGHVSTFYQLLTSFFGPSKINNLLPSKFLSRTQLLLPSAIIHTVIIESVDSISRDGPDTPINIIHYKKRNNSEQVKFKLFNCNSYDLWQNTCL